MDEGLWTMVSSAGTMEKAILVLLLVCSIALWTIVFLKLPEFIAARRSSAKFMKLFQDAPSFAVLNDLPADAASSVQCQVLQSAFKAMNGESGLLDKPRNFDLEKFRSKAGNASEEIILLSMQHRATAFFAHMQSGLSYMATIGSTTPFIGLFGTVVGIMTTFHDLGQVKGAPSMQVVAPGISGALVATAAGLAVAIPAVIMCNWFNAEIDELREQMNTAIERAMALIRQGYHEPGKSPVVQTNTNAAPSHKIHASELHPVKA